MASANNDGHYAQPSGVVMHVNPAYSGTLQIGNAVHDPSDEIGDHQ